MVKTLIVSHGELALALLRSAETIAGHNPHVAALCLAWDDGPAEARTKVESAITELRPDDGVLILTDMFGGTPNNVASGFTDREDVEVVAGVNLPMVLRLECMAETGLSVGKLAEWIASKGKGSIRHHSRTAAGRVRAGGPADG